MPTDRCKWLNGDAQCRVGHLVISFGATQPPAHPEDGGRVSSLNIRKTSQLDVAVCPTKFN
jgi:hypothetical protein